MTKHGARWRMVVDGPREGDVNMAADELMLSLVGAVPSTILRFYRWSRPTLSIGRGQRASQAVDLGCCRSLGIPIVRRPTGGQAVLHEVELTYSIASTDPRFFSDPSPYSPYTRVSSALLRGFGNIGLTVELAARMRRLDRARVDPCFLEAGFSELLYNGRKICGSAQRRFRDRFLQHGSIPIVFDAGVLAACTRSDIEALKRGATSIRAALGREPANIESHFGAGFSAEFGVELEAGTWEALELIEIDRLARDKYSTPEWNLEGDAQIGR